MCCYAQILVSFALSACIVGCSAQNWYTYSGSVEDTVSQDATNELLRLAPGQRYRATSNQMCLKRDKSFNCAWVEMNQTQDLGLKPVRVSCFSEWRRQCSRHPLSGEGSVKTYRPPQCSQCSQCAGSSWNNCRTCSMTCYCTCPDEKFEKVADVPTFPCEELCGSKSHCQYKSTSTEINCDYYKLAGDRVRVTVNSVNSENSVKSVNYTKIIIYTGITVLTVGFAAAGIFIIWRYIRYAKLMS